MDNKTKLIILAISCCFYGLGYFNGKISVHLKMIEEDAKKIADFIKRGIDDERLS
ncbi:hypothetical protein ES702_04971 [subsurface metagenome]